MSETSEYTLGEHVVHVPTGGYYDRYRMKADLAEVAKDPEVPGVDFFRGLPKRAVESPIGPTSTPNYYYAMSIVQIAMLAPMGAVRTRLPKDLQPLQPAPGVGLIVLAFFRYDVCDVDPYNEATVAIATRPPRHRGPVALDFVHAMRTGTTYGYPLSLPVNTEIAKVRGLYGYGLPKWRTDIDIDLNGPYTARVTNDHGDTDVAVKLDVPKQRPPRAGHTVRTTIALSELDNAWYESASLINVLQTGSTLRPQNVQITRGTGRLTDDLASLRPFRTLSVDATTRGQLALNMPVPTAIG
jgi:hypothetical protein